MMNRLSSQNMFSGILCQHIFIIQRTDCKSFLFTNIFVKMVVIASGCDPSLFFSVKLLFQKPFNNVCKFIR